MMKSRIYLKANQPSIGASKHVETIWVLQPVVHKINK